MPMCISIVQARTECLAGFGWASLSAAGAGIFFVRPCMILRGSLWDDLVEILLIPLYEVLAWSCTEVLHRRSCVKGERWLETQAVVSAKKHETIHSIKAIYPQFFAFLALTTPLSVFLRCNTSRICTFSVDFEDPHAIGHGRWKPSFCIIDASQEAAVFCKRKKLERIVAHEQIAWPNAWGLSTQPLKRSGEKSNMLNDLAGQTL